MRTTGRPARSGCSRRTASRSTSSRVNDPEAEVTGATLQKRDRKSIAILNQVSGEYRGDFFDNKLTVNVGVRAPFFMRELNNFCFTSSGVRASSNASARIRRAKRRSQLAQPYTFDANGRVLTGWSPPQKRKSQI